MKKRILYIAWGCLYVLCAGLGHISNPGPTQSWALTAMSVIFFIPGFLLLTDALKAGDGKTLFHLRLISGISLGLTVILLVANMFSVLGSELLGDVLYEFLILLSVPMICSQHWVLSLFLWAYMFFSTLSLKKKK